MVYEHISGDARMWEGYFTVLSESEQLQIITQHTAFEQFIKMLTLIAKHREKLYIKGLFKKNILRLFLTTKLSNIERLFKKKIIEMGFWMIVLAIFKKRKHS